MSFTSQKLPVKYIAEYFVAKAQEDEKPLTNKKLQKLLYYAQAWSITLNKEKIFDAKIEAWIHGPAIREVYVEYKNFGFQPILKEIKSEWIKEIPSNTQKFLDDIWNVYGKYDAAYLEHLTHSEEPWLKAREGIEAHAGSEKEISADDMRNYYGNKLAELKKVKTHGNSQSGRE